MEKDAAFGFGLVAAAPHRSCAALAVTATA
jgi:hypothetical protein